MTSKFCIHLVEKGLVQTEGLQPARDTLQLLLHWDPNKTGRLYKVKRKREGVETFN
jgi:hypothetical protein